MAWNKESTAARRARVAKQLRDKHGKWIEMGGGVKWFKNGSWHNGTASAFQGSNVVVKMDDGSEELVNHRQIEPIRSKGSLGAKPAKPAGSVQARKSKGATAGTVSIKDNDPGKRLTTNAKDLEEGDEVHLVGKDSPRYSISDSDAQGLEDTGFDVNTDDKGESVRARVVDTSGDRVVVEDSAGKRHEISKNDNVLADDTEVDAALQNADEVGKTLGDVLPDEMRAMPNGTELDTGNGTSFRKDGKDSWQRINSDGQNVGNPSTSAFLHQNLENKDAEFLSKKEAAAKNGDRKGGEAPKGKDITLEPSKPKDEAPASDIDLEGLDLTDDDKAKINSAQTGEEALKALMDSDAGQYLPIARQNKNKAFVDAYRKAVNGINDKHKVVEKDAPKEEAKKAEGTPQAALEKTAANLAEDIADIKGQKLEKQPEEVALAEAAYDVKNDAGEEFLLTPKRDEEGDTFQVDVTDSKGNVVDTLPVEDQKPEEFAQAIKNSIESKSTSDGNEAPTEAPAAPEENAPKADEATPTGPFADRIESVRDQLSAIAKDAFENNNTATEHVDLGDGKIVEVTKGMDKGKVAGLTVKLRDKENAGNTSKTTDQKGSQTSSDAKGFEESVDRLKDVVAHIESRQAIFGDHTPEAKKFAEEDTKRRLEEGNKEIADRKAAEEARKAAEAEAPASDAESGTREHLDKALKDAGYSDEEAKAIGDAASTDESEADKQFFQSETGKKGNVKPDEKFKAARKALDDFMKANNENVKAQHDKSDETRQEVADSKDSVEEHFSPEAQDQRAADAVGGRTKSTSDEAKLAEIDRKISVGEKMLDDAKQKENAPLVKRLEENIAALKKQREKLSPSEAPASDEAAPQESAVGSKAGTPFDSPEGGVAILSNKKLEKKTADFMKNGDQFLARVDEKGKLRPIMGNDMRVTPDGESYTVTGVKKTSSNTSITATDSKGNEHTFEFGVGDRKGNVILDTDKNRESLGLTDKSPKAEPTPTEEIPDSGESSSDAAPLSQADVASAMDELEAQIGKIKAKTMEATIAKVAPVELPNGNVLTMGLDKGSIAYEVQDKDGNILGHVSFMSGSQDKREQDILALASKNNDEGDSNAPSNDESAAPDTEADAPSIDEPAPGDEDVPEAELEVPAEKDPEEQKLADDFIAEVPEETQDASEGPTSDEVASMVEEALSDIDDDLEEFGGDANWEDISLREWPIIRDGKATGYHIAAGDRSTNEDRFLGLYDSDNNELETFDMEGNSTNGADNGADAGTGTDGPGAGDGGDDSSGGGVSEGDGPDSGAGNGDGESDSGNSVDPAEFDARAAKLVSAVQKELVSGEDRENVQLDDEYSVEFATDMRGKETYRLYDSNDRTLVKIARTNEDRLGEILRGYTDAERELKRAFESEAGSDSRRVTPTRQMQKLADIGTYFENDRGDRFTKITAYSWGMSKAGDNSDNKEMGIIEGHGRLGSGEMTLGHHVDHHRPMNEIEAMSDDELRKNIAHFADRIHGIIEVDGKIGDKQGQGGLKQGQRDQELMQRFRYESHRLNEEAADYANTLWQRLRENGAHKDGSVDTGEFNSSPEIPHTTRDASINDDQWRAVRNEYVGLDHRTIKHNFELRNSDKPSRAAVAWGNKMDKWARTGELADDFTMYRSVLASPDAATEFSAGNVVTDKGVMSLADNLNTAEVYLDARTKRTAGKIPIIMEVQGRKGEKMTAADFGSDELVAPRGSRLFVSSAEMGDDGILHVTARLNPSDAEIAEWTNKSSSDNNDAPNVTPEAPEAAPSAPSAPEATSPEPKTPRGLPEAKDPDNPVNGEKGFQQYDGSGLKGKPSGQFTQVEGFENGDRVFHGKHGAGTIVKRENNGQFARILFDKDKDTGKVMGISLTKVTKGESAPEAPDAPKSPAKTITPRPTTVKEGSTAETGEWKNGERVTHGKHGAGTIKRLEGNGEYARVEFDGMPGTKGIKLTQLGRGDTPAPSKPETPAKVKTPKVPKAPLATAPEGSPGQIGGWTLGDKLVHKSKGSGVLKSFGKDGTFGMIEFDNEPGVQRGIRFSGLSKSDTSTPSSIVDPPTAVNGPDGKPVNSGNTDTRTDGKDGDTGSPVFDKNNAELYIGAVVVHPQLGRGRVVKIGTGPNAGIQVIFDNDPTNKPKSLSGARLKDIAIAPKGATDKTSL